MQHMSFVEGARTDEEKPIFANVPGIALDSVFIQVSVETYITPQFQEWLMNVVLPRISHKCDAVRIAIKNTRGN